MVNHNQAIAIGVFGVTVLAVAVAVLLVTARLGFKEQESSEQ